MAAYDSSLLGKGLVQVLVILYIIPKEDKAKKAFSGLTPTLADNEKHLVEINPKGCVLFSRS